MRRAAPKAGTSVEDCAFENFVDHCCLCKPAQLRHAAAGLERSAALPASGFWALLKSHRAAMPTQQRCVPLRLAPGIEARRAETKFRADYERNYRGLGSRKPGRAIARGAKELTFS